MGEKKQAAVGFIGIGIIIAIIAGVVLVLLPEEPETVQNADVAKPNNIELDPITVEQYEKVFPFFQDSFRLILEQCHAVNSYTNYLAFGESIPWTKNEIFIGIEDAKKALTLSEELGYNSHPTIGPMIKAARVLEEAASDCIIDLQDKYEKNLETIKKQKEKVIPQVDMEDEVKSISLRERYDNAIGWDAEDKVIRDWLSSYTGSGKAELTFTEAINYLLVITYTEEERNHPEASIWIEYLENTDIPWKKGFEYSGRYVDVILHVKVGYDDDTYRWLIDLDEEVLYGTDEGSNEILSLLDIE